MASPSISTNLVVLHQMNSGAMTAPLLEGANTPALFPSGEGGIGFDTSTNVTGLYGARYDFAASDFSLGQYVTYQLAFRQYDSMRNTVDLVTGGVRVLFEDSQGAWVRFNTCGGDLNTNPSASGTFKSFKGIGNNGDNDRGMVFFIDRAATPDSSSGVIDWGDIVAVELHINGQNSDRFDMYMGLLGYADRPSGLQGDASNPIRLIDYYEEFLYLPSGFRSTKILQPPPKGFMGASALPYFCSHGFEIGDGATETYFSDSNGAIAFYASRRAFDTVDLGGDDGYTVALTDTGTTSRGLIINIPLGSTCELNTFSLSGVGVSGGDYFVLNQSAEAPNFNVVDVVNCANFVCGLINLSAVNFRGCYTVEVSAETSAEECRITDMGAGGKGLYLNDSPGDYSSLDFDFNNSANNRITLAANSGGTYNLTGIRSAEGNMHLHNDSATEAITVQLDPSITSVTTSTEGGNVTVGNAVTYTMSADMPDGVTGIFVIHDLDSANPDNLGSELQRNNNASGTQTYNFPSTKASDAISLQVIANGYRRYLNYITLPSSNFAIQINLEQETN